MLISMIIDIMQNRYNETYGQKRFQKHKKVCKTAHCIWWWRQKNVGKII